MTAAKADVGVRAGDAESPCVLFELVYAELKRMAHNRLRDQNAGGAGLDTTSLVHECFLRMHSRGELHIGDRPRSLVTSDES